MMQQIYKNRTSPNIELLPAIEPQLKNGFWENIVTVTIFLITVLFLAIGTWVIKPSGYMTLEFRKRAEFPNFSLKKKEWQKFPAVFESYFNDRFAFRAELLACRSYLSYFLLQESGSASVVVGSAGWLYLNGQKNLESFRNVQPYTETELKHLVGGLERQRDWLAQRNIHYLFFVVPGKPTIYPEYLPMRLNKTHAKSRLDQLLSYLERHSTINVIDLRTTLLACKSKNILYYKTDSHWNDIGAFLAYKQVGAYISHWFPSVKLWQWTDFDKKEAVFNHGGLSTMIGLNNIITESAPYLVPRRKRECLISKYPQLKNADIHNPCVVIHAYATELNKPGLPRAVMLRDSMTTALQPFLSEHFRRIVYLWQPDFPVNEILKEHPDIVIQEVVERELMCNLPQTLEEVNSHTNVLNK